MSEWISVEDGLPEEDDYVLAYVCVGINDKEFQIEVESIGEHPNAWVGHPNKPENKCNWYVTHWMPLPQPPKH